MHRPAVAGISRRCRRHWRRGEWGKATDRRALRVVRAGTAWAAVTEKAPERINLRHLVSY